MAKKYVGDWPFFTVVKKPKRGYIVSFKKSLRGVVGCEAEKARSIDYLDLRFKALATLRGMYGIAEEKNMLNVMEIYEDMARTIISEILNTPDTKLITESAL